MMNKSHTVKKYLQLQSLFLYSVGWVWGGGSRLTAARNSNSKCMQPFSDGRLCCFQLSAVEKDGKPNLSASAMLKRKRIFHNSLISMTKEHHAVS